MPIVLLDYSLGDNRPKDIHVGPHGASNLVCWHIAILLRRISLLCISFDNLALGGPDYCLCFHQFQTLIIYKVSIKQLSMQ